jgi:hypothetical protein
MIRIKIIVNIVALFFCLTAVAQKNLKDSVKILYSDSRGVIMLKGYFNKDIMKVLLQQLSAEKIALIEKNYNEADYPECIKDLLEYKISDSTSDERIARVFAALKMYRIAKFENIRNGENFGEESILVVPASENKNVGGTCNFTTDFYIIIPSKDIKVL